MIRFASLLIALCLWPHVGSAAPVQTDHVEAELVAEMQSARPGGETWVALRLRPDPGWHTYWRNPGDSGLPTRLEWQLPEAVEAGELHWPYPHREALGELTNYGYSGETLHLVPIRVPDDWPAGKPLPLQASASWLVCKDICIPGQANLDLLLPVEDAPPRPDPVWQPFFDETRAEIPVDVDWPGRFEATGSDLTIAFEMPELPRDLDVAFFPDANDLVSHAAAQRIGRDGNWLRLSQRLSDYFVEAPQAVAGVLVVRTVGEAQAYRVSARPGEVEPVPASGAAAAPAAHSGTPAAPASGSEGPAAVDASGLGLAAGLLFAFLGGLILNLMPCVFPVLSIKAISLLESGSEGHGHRGHALAYTGGVLLCFGGLAGALIALRGSGDAIGWGFQLQQPVFVALLAYLFFAMALSLSGAVHFGTRLMGLGQSLTQSGGLRGSFFTGVLAVVVASPCSAPFMGVALGFALTQSPALAIAVFLALGLGLAVPFLLIGFVPALGRLLPRPGPWMETFKQVMAFPLYLTVVWLLWVLGGLTDRSGMALAACGLVLVSFAAWLWNRPGHVALTLRLASVVVALGLLAHPLLRTAAAPAVTAATDRWETYSDARLLQARGEGRTVFVNFTADWCITCKLNERVALSTAAVRQAFADHDVLYLKGDWTRPDPAITAVLERFGRSGVPLYLLFRGEDEAIVLPQLLTPETVVRQLESSSAT